MSSVLICACCGNMFIDSYDFKVVQFYATKYSKYSDKFIYCEGCDKELEKMGAVLDEDLGHYIVNLEGDEVRPFKIYTFTITQDWLFPYYFHINERLWRKNRKTK